MLLLFPSEKYSLLRVLGAAATESSKIQQHVLRRIFVRSFGDVDRPKILEVTVGYYTAGQRRCRYACLYVVAFK